MFDEINSQMAELSPIVQVWANWMMFIFAVSVFFVRKYWEARFALVSISATMMLAMTIFAVWRNVHLFALAHILCWTPLLIYIVKKWRAAQEEKYRTWGLFRIWLGMLVLTMVISLPLDIRDVILVITGQK